MDDPARAPPLDHPYAARPHRVYLALTNACNRACPWCSTCSSPLGRTWSGPAAAWAHVPREGTFELQLEGGEPTIHPAFWELVARARAEPRCTRLVVCTNGVVLPRRPDRLRAWLDRLGRPLTIKLSVNHHLLDHDAGLLALARGVRDAFAGDADRLLVVNVRLRRGEEDDDRAVARRVDEAGLGPHANVFFLQRYGFAAERLDWDLPVPVSGAFTLVNPDGVAHGTDLVARSEAMRRLP